MKLVITTLIISLLCIGTFAQTISAVELKSDITGIGKLKKAPKKVFISQFRVMYQVLYIAEDEKKGSVYEGGMTGDVKVQLAIGLQGLTETDLVQNTNYLYQQFINRLKTSGYEIISADEVAGIKVFKDWERKKGGGLSNAQYKGFIMSTPENFDYFIKGSKKDGGEKSTFTDNSAKISYQLDNVTVMRINLVIPLAEEAESWASGAFKLGGAKVVAETALRLTNEMATTGKTFSADLATTQLTFANSEAMSLPTSTGFFNLKKAVEINDVIERKKYKVTGVSNHDWTGTNMGLYQLFEVDNQFIRKVIPVPVEPAKYNNGVRKAGEEFFKACLDEFLSATK
ncbi:MAG: hypothetical protein Q7U59_00340 [Lutibacter sp.]|nr:hypothetical protein [Lutibacter sp.]MDP2067423.1 hypothetical protein [Lutibacter sp.]